MQRIGDQRLAGAGQRIEPGGEVDGVAGHRVLRLAARADHRRHHLAAGDADVQAQRLAIAVGQAGRSGMHCQRRAHCAFAVVAVRHGRAEDGHHGIAGAVEDAATVGFDNAVHRRVEAAEQCLHLLRVAACALRGVAADVGEQHRRLAAVGAVDVGCRAVARQRRCGPHDLRQLHRRAALVAELRLRPVRMPAARAQHWRPKVGRRADICHGRASSTRLKGVCAARRKLEKPPLDTTSRSRCSPACAPRQRPTSCEREAGVQMKVEAA